MVDVGLATLAVIVLGMVWRTALLWKRGQLLQ